MFTGGYCLKRSGLGTTGTRPGNKLLPFNQDNKDTRSLAKTQAGVPETRDDIVKTLPFGGFEQTGLDVRRAGRPKIL